SIGGRVEASLDVWVANIGKSWQWDLIPVNIELGTNPMFDLQSVSTGTSVHSPANSEQEHFNENNRLVVDQFYESGRFDTDQDPLQPGGGAGLAFTGIQPDTGRMELLFAKGGPDGFGSPTLIAEADGIVSSSLVAIGGGAWMAIWCEIEGNQFLNPYPNSQIKYAHSENEGQNWSTPEILMTASGVCRDIEATASNGEVALALIHTTQGPASANADLLTAVWSRGAWSQLERILTNEAIQNIRVTAKGSWVVGVLMANGDLMVADWTASTPSLLTLIKQDVRSSFDIVQSNEGQLVMAWGDTDGNLMAGMLSSDATSLSQERVILPSSYPSLIRWAPMQGTQEVSTLALAWSQGFQSRDLRLVRLEASLEPTSPIAILESPTTGDVRNWQPIINAEGEVGLLSHWSGETSSLKIWNESTGIDDPKIQVTQFRMSSDGQLIIDIEGPVGAMIRLEQSPNFETWTPVDELSPLALPGSFSVSISESQEALFFRGILVP
ncbi:MAG: hypothetical protein HOH33_17165, partial [Verrucomicrobia bacterium]|nr:hypothetical protein [Verrucomicrobiota bacterium]